MTPRVVVLVSADAEWRPTIAALSPSHIEETPYGESFTQDAGGEPCVFLHGGWGKIAAAASAEYAISRWRPDLLLNLGTCGGIAGRVARGDLLLVTRTIAYDIEEAMGDAAEAVHARSTDIDLGWLRDGLPFPTRAVHLVSGDRDLRPAAVPDLVRRFDAVAADWESAAIAYVAKRRGTRLLIIRGVSDLVDEVHGEVIGDLAGFQAAAAAIMRTLLGHLPAIVRAARMIASM